MTTTREVTESELSLEDFRAALSLWPSGVTITTTTDGDGQRWGFTASAFSSLSLNPPLILVCLAADAECHSAFSQARGFAVNLLSSRHEKLAIRFATRGVDKFDGGNFRPGHHGSPVLADAVASLECAAHACVPAGDHTILIGRVLRAHAHPAAADNTAAMVHFARGFRTLNPMRGTHAKESWADDSVVIHE